MVHIIENTEQHLEYDRMLEKAYGRLKSSLSSAIGYSSVLAAANLDAKCIITPSVTGATTRVVSNLRPKQVILGRDSQREGPAKNVHLLGRCPAEVHAVQHDR